MTQSIVLVGLSIILIPSIRATLSVTSPANSTLISHNNHSVDHSHELSTSHFLPLLINAKALSNGSILPSIEPIIPDSHLSHSHSPDNDFKPMTADTPVIRENGSDHVNRRQAHLDQNVSSSVNDHRMWTSKRVKPAREMPKESSKELIKETTEESSLDMGDGRANSFDELKFDQNYFALLNAVNHRPVPSSLTFDSPKNEKNANVNNPTNEPGNNLTRSIFYYSPETYGKVSHKNHQNTAFSFNWPPTVSQPTTGLTSLSTPSASLTPNANISPSESPSTVSSPSQSIPSSSALTLSEHLNKPSKHDSSTFGLFNTSPIIKSYNEKTSNSTTIKHDPKPNNYLTIDPSKIIAERGPAITGENSKNVNSNNDNNYHGLPGEITSSENNGDEAPSESNESPSEGQNSYPVDSNISSNNGSPENNNNNNNNNGNNFGANVNRFYDTGAYMVSKGRSKVVQGPGNGDKIGKPLRFQDHVMQQQPPSMAPSIDYLEEDYDSTDAFPDIKNFQPIVKSSTTGVSLPSPAAKFNGPAPYRHPYYSSYYPTRFYGPPLPYDDDNSPSKSNNNVNSWSGLAGFLLGIIPLGILMASMVPAFVSVPVATAAAGVGRRRRRSLLVPAHSRENDPVHEILSQYEMKVLKDTDCIKEILCKIANQGREQKMGKQFFDATLNMRYNKIYHKLGIGQIMEAAKRNECEQIFTCKKQVRR